MTVSRYATQAGKRYETDLLKYLREQGFDTERLRLVGAEDEGDLVIRTAGGPLIVEAKRRKAMDLSGWMDEAELEAANYAGHRSISHVPFVVIHHRRGKSLGQAYVTQPLGQWKDFL